jgi:hypothetical protein
VEWVDREDGCLKGQGIRHMESCAGQDRFKLFVHPEDSRMQHQENPPSASVCSACMLQSFSDGQQISFQAWHSEDAVFGMYSIVASNMGVSPSKPRLFTMHRMDASCQVQA